MALSRHGKYICRLYVLAALMIVVGVVIITVGLIVVNDLKNEILSRGRSLAVLQADEIHDWGDIAGTRDRDLIHQFHVFNVTNPKEILYGQTPISMMFGPWTFEEERLSEQLSISKATDAFGYTGELFSYFDNVTFDKTGVPTGFSNNLSEVFNVYNFETFTMQFSHRTENDYMRAIRALSGMINYTSTQFRDFLIMSQIQKDQPNVYNTQQTFNQRRLFVFNIYPTISQDTRQNFWADATFGFSNFNNSMFWGKLCDNQRSSYALQFIYDFFFIPRSALNEFINLFCTDWNNAAKTVDSYLSVGNDKSPEAIFYRQWSSSAGSRNVLDGVLSMAQVDSLISGWPEMNVFYEERFKTTDQLRRQFSATFFSGVQSLESRILQLFKEDNMEVSLFNATNMKQLFSFGEKVEIDISTGWYQTELLRPLQLQMNNRFSTEELFVVYKYLVNLINYSYLKVDTNQNTFDKISMAFTLPEILRREFSNFRAIFTSKLVGAVAHRYLSLETCESSSSRFFRHISTNAACNNEALRLNTLAGIEFWLRLYIGRSVEDEKTLTLLTGLTLSNFDEVFLVDESEFILFVRSIFTGIGAGNINTICRNNNNVW